MNNLHDKLAEIQERVDAATEGKWWVRDSRTCSGINSPNKKWGYTDKSGKTAFTIRAGKSQGLAVLFDNNENNADFIAHSRTDIPLLLKMLRRAVEGLERANKAPWLDDMSDAVMETLAELEEMTAGSR